MAEHVENQDKTFVEVILHASTILKFYAFNTRESALGFIRQGFLRKNMAFGPQGEIPPRAVSLDATIVTKDGGVLNELQGFVDFDAVVAMSLMPDGWKPATQPQEEKKPWEQ